MAGHTKWSEIKHKASPERRVQRDAKLRARSAIVKRTVDAADPEGLLRMGAPDDEYDSEVAMIAVGLCEIPAPTAARIEDLLVDVWHAQFERLVEGHESGYRQRLKPLAEALAVALRSPA